MQERAGLARVWKRQVGLVAGPICNGRAARRECIYAAVRQAAQVARLHRIAKGERVGAVSPVVQRGGGGAFARLECQHGDGAARGDRNGLGKLHKHGDGAPRCVHGVGRSRAHRCHGRPDAVYLDIGRVRQRAGLARVGEGQDGGVAGGVRDRAVARNGQGCYARIAQVVRGVAALHRVQECQRVRAVARRVRGSPAGAADIQCQERQGAGAAAAAAGDDDRLVKLHPNADGLVHAVPSVEIRRRDPAYGRGPRVGRGSDGAVARALRIRPVGAGLAHDADLSGRKVRHHDAALSVCGQAERVLELACRLAARAVRAGRRAVCVEHAESGQIRVRHDDAAGGVGLDEPVVVIALGGAERPLERAVRAVDVDAVGRFHRNDAAVPVDGHGVRRRQEAGCRPRLADGKGMRAVLVEHGNAVVSGVGDDYVAVRGNGHAVRPRQVFHGRAGDCKVERAARAVHQNAVAGCIGHNDAARVVDGDAARGADLPYPEGLGAVAVECNDGGFGAVRHRAVVRLHGDQDAAVRSRRGIVGAGGPLGRGVKPAGKLVRGVAAGAVDGVDHNVLGKGERAGGAGAGQRQVCGQAIADAGNRGALGWQDQRGGARVRQVRRGVAPLDPVLECERARARSGRVHGASSRVQVQVRGGPVGRALVRHRDGA